MFSRGIRRELAFGYHSDVIKTDQSLEILPTHITLQWDVAYGWVDNNYSSIGAATEAPEPVVMYYKINRDFDRNLNW